MFNTLAAAALSAWLVSVAVAEDYYPLKEGNNWTYRLSDGQEMVVQVAGFADVRGVRCAVVEKSIVGQGTSRTYLAIDPEGVKTYKMRTPQGEIEYPVPPIQIKLPFKQGERWQARQALGQQAVLVDMESAGRETIQVPAGTFECIRINSVTTVGANRISSSNWYADGIGEVQATTAVQGREISLKLARTNVSGPAAPPPVAQAEAPAGLAMEKHLSKDGRVMLFRPKGWKVDEVEFAGGAGYEVGVTEPNQDAAVAFVAFKAQDGIADSEHLAVAFLDQLRVQYPDMQVSGLKSLPDKTRTDAILSATIEGKKAVGHAYLFHTTQLSSAYLLLAREDLWGRLVPTLAAIAANLSFAPEGIERALQQAQAARNTPAAMLIEAVRKQGSQLPLQTCQARDGAFTIDLPQGWGLMNDGMNFSASNDLRTNEYGVGFRRSACPPPYLPPPQALAMVLQSSNIARNLQITSECRGDQLPPAAVEVSAIMTFVGLCVDMQARGNRADLRVLHAQYVNPVTGRAERGIYIVASAALLGLPTWECWIAGFCAPAADFDGALPHLVRMAESYTINQQWSANMLAAQKAEGRRLQAGLQRSLAEKQASFDSYLASVKRAGDVADYGTWRFSQAILGQGSWVAENEGAKVYQTDSWGIQGPDGGVDSRAYNNTHFTGKTPWGQNTKEIDSFDMWQRHIQHR